MANNGNPTHVVTGKVRLSYAHLTQPYKSQLADENDKAKYSTTLLIPKADRATKAKIDRMHALNLYKLRMMPAFEPEI